MHILLIPADRTEPHGGARNVGDALLTDMLLEATRAHGHAVEVYDFGGTRMTSDGARTYGSRIWGLWRAIGRSDAVVIGGGTMLQDDRPDRPLGGLPRLCATVSTMARMRRRPVGFFGVGLDPIRRASARQLIRVAVARRPVWLREEHSCERFREYFGRDAHLGADAALLASQEWRDASRVQGRCGLALALNRSDARGLTASSVRRWREEYGEVRFLSMDQEAGDADADALGRDVRQELGYRPEVLGWREASSVIAGSRAVVASRMHALYLAALHEVPAVAVGNLSKVGSFCREFDVPQVAQSAAFDPGIERAPSRGALAAASQRAADGLSALLSELCPV